MGTVYTQALKETEPTQLLQTQNLHKTSHILLITVHWHMK